jgi:hypothetical protein
MEAEISATLLDDPSSPYACPSMPDNVFSVSSPGPVMARYAGQKIVHKKKMKFPSPILSPLFPVSEL